MIRIKTMMPISFCLPSPVHVVRIELGIHLDRGMIDVPSDQILAQRLRERAAFGNEAVSFQVSTDSQEETDRYWDAIVGHGGQESRFGWCKDRFGLSWQIIPRALMSAVRDPDRAAAKRAMDAMMGMKKIDIAAIERAREGGAFA